MEYLVFFSIVAAIAGAIWYVTDRFLKNEAVIIARNNTASELVKQDLQKFKEQIVDTPVVIEKKTKDVVAEVKAVKTRRRVKK
jgi:hypothetical protein